VPRSRAFLRSFLFLSFLGWSGTAPAITEATTGLLYQFWMMMMMMMVSVEHSVD
jgi:hypothetical protein